MDRRGRLQVTGALRTGRARADAPSAPSRLQGKLVHACKCQTGRLAPWARIPPDILLMAMHIREFLEANRVALITLWEACALTRPWNARMPTWTERLRHAMPRSSSARWMTWSSPVSWPVMTAIAAGSITWLSVRSGRDAVMDAR